MKNRRRDLLPPGFRTLAGGGDSVLGLTMFAFIGQMNSILRIAAHQPTTNPCVLFPMMASIRGLDTGFARADLALQNMQRTVRCSTEIFCLGDQSEHRKKIHRGFAFDTLPTVRSMQRRNSIFRRFPFWSSHHRTTLARSAYGTDSITCT